MGHVEGFAGVEGSEKIEISTFSTQDYATIVVAKHFSKTKEFLVVFIYRPEKEINLMNKKRNIWLIAGVVILLAALVSAFVVMQPSAKDILTQTLETSKTIENGHAIVNISVDSPEEKASATVEVWGRP